MSILRVNSITPYTGSLLTVNGDILITGNFTGSSVGNVGSRLTNLESETTALESFTSSFSTSVNSRLDSVQTYTASVSTSVGILQSTASLFVPFSTSVDSRLGVVEATASLHIPLSTSVNSRLGSIEAATASLQVSTNALNSVTASYATTGSNIFVGAQTISGSTVITGNLNVFGSSSFTTVTSSIYIGGNRILLNTFTPSVRYGGIEVIDSGSTGLTGSMLWDSQNDVWIYVNPSGSTYVSARFISGPKSNTLGSEPLLTQNTLPKADDGDHMIDSQITDDGTTVTIPNTASIGNIVGFGSPTAFSTSVDSRLVRLATTGSNTFIGNQVVTGSLTVSGSNTFIGNQTVSGSLTVSGSAAFTGSTLGNIVSMSIVSNTASIDFSAGNYFTLKLNASATPTRLNPTNVKAGQTVSLVVTQAATLSGSLSFPTSFKFPTGSYYTASRVVNAVDILTFVTVDTASIHTVSVKSMGL